MYLDPHSTILRSNSIFFCDENGFQWIIGPKSASCMPGVGYRKHTAGSPAPSTRNVRKDQETRLTAGVSAPDERNLFHQQVLAILVGIIQQKVGDPKRKSLLYARLATE
jgi:hypothetical protein